MLFWRRVLHVLFCAGLLVAPTIFGQTPPTPGELPKTDFTGRWRMSKDKSQFGTFRMPDIVVRIIDQHPPTMNVHTVQTAGDKTSTIDATYFTDGTSTKNVINGRDAESRTYWDGAVLVIRTSMKTAGGDNEEIEDRWELSEDKQTLTIASHVETSKGVADMKMVCDREKTGT